MAHLAVCLYKILHKTLPAPWRKVVKMFSI